MSTKNYFAPGSNYYDHHREITFNNPGANAVDLLRAALAEDVEPIQAEPVQSPSGELFKYIHVAVTSDDERLQIHRMVSNIVHLPRMKQICDELYQLIKKEKVLSSIKPEAMLAELRRIGMPSPDNPGFSDQNFYSNYRV